MVNGVDKRIDYIDIVKAFAIISVVAFHTVSDDSLAKFVISGFVMQLFFIVAGLNLKRREENSFSSWYAFMGKRFVSLVVPYFIWAAIYASLSFRNLALIAYGSRETLSLAGSLTSLWFLSVLFVAHGLTQFVLYLSNNHSFYGKQHIITIVGMIVLAIAGFLIPHLKAYGWPWGFDVALMGAAFMLFGLEIRSWVDKFYQSGRLFQSIIFLVSSVLYLYVLQFSKPASGFIFMGIADYGNPVVFVLSSVFGSIAVITISILVCVFAYHKCFLIKKILFYIGKNTLGIFVIHKPIVRGTRQFISNSGYDYNSAPFAIAITIFGLLVSLVIVKVINRYAPSILGKPSQASLKL